MSVASRDLVQPGPVNTDRQHQHESVFGQGLFRACWRARGRLRTHYAALILRSYSLRRAIVALRSWRERLLPNSHRSLVPHEAPCVVASLSIDAAASALRREGFSPTLRLPPALHEQIKRFAERSPCIRWGFNDAPQGRFYMDEASTGRLPDGRLVGVADVDLTSSCSAIERVARDPYLLDLYKEYFGFWPRRVQVRLFWTPTLDAGHPARALLPNRGGMYHYDVGSLSQLFVFFYLTDVDRHSGAHALIPATHRKSVPRFGDRYFSDEEVYRWYGEGSEVVIEGTAGFGFVEDPTCIHKYYVPTKKRRLALQVRYH